MSEPIELFSHHLGIISYRAPESLWAALPARGGVYAFADGENRVIKVAASQSVRRSVKHRLTVPEPLAGRTRKADLASVTRQIWWLPTHSRFETTWRYYRIVRALYPGQYRRLVAFGPA